MLDLLKEKLLTFFATVVSDQMHKGGFMWGGV